MKHSKSLLGLVVAASSVALAQSPIAAQVPGTVDPVKATNTQQADRAGYNSAVSQFSPRGIKGTPVPAAASDILPGSPVRDILGEPVARVDAVVADGVVVDTGTAKVRMPANAFGKDELGLLLGIPASKFRSLVAKVTAAKSGG
jgi:hypothetical protein